MARSKVSGIFNFAYVFQICLSVFDSGRFIIDDRHTGLICLSPSANKDHFHHQTHGP